MAPPDDPERLTYADVGVDIAAGEKAVELIKAHVRSTFRPEVVGDIGGFGGLFDIGRLAYRDPLLVSSTDGVGTKSVTARLMRRYDTIGIDCVAMSVDDVAAHGAEPLFFLDYISVGKLVPEDIDDIVSGVARGCREAGCALIARGRWDEPRIFREIQSAGNVTDDEMEHVFNLGVGMLAVVAPGDAHPALDSLRASGHEAWEIGEIAAGRGRVFVQR